MAKPTDNQLATLGAAFDTFARRYKLADVANTDRPLNELDKLALLYVADHPGCGPSDLARYLGVPNTTISSATDRLAKRGMLARDRVAEDRRAVALQLTPEGTQYATAQQHALRDMVRLMLERLEPGERDHFIAMISKIVYHED